MLLCFLSIALAVSFVVGLACALIYIAKKKIPIAKPLLLGGFAMLAGYFGASLLMLALNAAIEAFAGRSFMDDAAAYLYLALTSGAFIALMMFFMLKGPLKDRRSAYETLAFGLGVAIPMCAIKALEIIWTNVSLIASGVDYATAALMLLTGAVNLALCLLEVFVALLLAHMLNEGKKTAGVFIALACEAFVYAALSLKDAFGFPAVVGPALSVAVCAVLAVYVSKIWDRLPPVKRDARVRRGAGDIPWPEPGEDGR